LATHQGVNDITVCSYVPLL